jgi:hypothetical protein
MIRARPGHPRERGFDDRQIVDASMQDVARMNE